MPSQLDFQEDICRYAVVIRIVGIYGFCSKFLVVAYSFIPIYGIFFYFSISEKGGSVGPVKQLIKLTWPNCGHSMSPKFYFHVLQNKSHWQFYLLSNISPSYD